MASLSCDHARDLFSEVLEESLGADLAASFDRHLHNCGRCQADFTDLRAAIGTLRSLEIERVPDNFHATLDARLAELHARPIRRVAALLIAAAALTLLCFGWPWLQRDAGSAPPATLAAAAPSEPDLERPPGQAPAPRDQAEPSAPAAAIAPLDATAITRDPATVSGDPSRAATVAAAGPRPIELKIDTRPLADLLATMWSSLRTVAAAAPAAPEAATTAEQTDEPAATLATAGPVATDPTPRAPAVTSSEEPSAPVVVVRGLGYVQIRTSGAPDEVIPALLALVAERDPELRSAAEEHLRLMHDSFMEDPELAAQLTPAPEPPRSLAALHDRDEIAHDSLHRWERWWNDNRQLVDR
jgi:hypothetical protein